MRSLSSLASCLFLWVLTVKVAVAQVSDNNLGSYSTIITWDSDSSGEPKSSPSHPSRSADGYQDQALTNTPPNPDLTTAPSTTSPSDPLTELILLTSPTQGALLPTSRLTLEWTYNFFYDLPFTIELLPMGATAMDESVFSTTVDPEDLTTVLPGSLLPSLDPGETAAFSVWLYTWDVYGGAGDFVDQVLLYADSATATATESVATATVTETRTVEVTPTSTAGDTGEGQDGDGGLSTGAKAGIGVGAGVGALVLAAVLGFILYRRQKRRKAPETIREISGAGPASMSTFGNASAVGDACSVSKDPRPASVPLALSPLSDAGSVRGSGVVSLSARPSGERERERFELGG
ncbi:uncharacterized protein DSM5745_04399 [Aspergillus mulundensis]|uniref:Mid2 domain-containing protein n=1 Tax=Aspergillus mulundensis TaxID=1810919 RepID=A0A3D8SCR0_9EURO|nr:hypothetical protein DSM5745_04399 [Aspergillus mulundensis]RDW84073.1 hypothetical protein DSM5745_04399 [Aspergillus mulundensis]